MPETSECLNLRSRRPAATDAHDVTNAPICEYVDPMRGHSNATFMIFSSKQVRQMLLSVAASLLATFTAHLSCLIHGFTCPFSFKQFRIVKLPIDPT